MKDNKKLVIIFVLIVLYFASFFINSFFVSNYIVYSNKVYRIKNNDLVLSKSEKITNKKINLVNKKFEIENAYYKNDNTGNNELFLYDKKYKSINKDRYYYGFTNDIDLISFKDNSSLNDKDINNISKIISKSNVNFSIKEFNYYNIVSFDNKKLIFIGNFNDSNNYGKTPGDLSKNQYYEFIIFKTDNKYKLIKKIVVDKEKYYDTDFLLFDCVLKTKDYYVGLEQINYSFFDSDSKNLYKIDKELKLIK